MAETKVTDNEIINHVVSSSNLGSRTQSVSPSGSSTIAYSSNNPTIELQPGRYMLIATASAKLVTSAQDSGFWAAIYNNTSSSEVSSNGTSSTGSSVTVWPHYTVQAIVTPTVATEYSGRLRQYYGTSAAYTFVNSTLIAIPL